MDIIRMACTITKYYQEMSDNALATLFADQVLELTPFIVRPIASYSMIS